jgi:hypothetical protein
MSMKLLNKFQSLAQLWRGCDRSHHLDTWICDQDELPVGSYTLYLLVLNVGNEGMIHNHYQ